MPAIILIKKDASVTSKNVKQFNFNHIHKYMSIRKKNDVSKQHIWKISKYEYIHIFCKTIGRANTINKYELPPPIDTPLYYGSLCLIKSTSMLEQNEDIQSMSIDEWNAYYNTLMGGFEDISDEDSYESDELDEYPEECITKDGYLKDGFIVDNEDDAYDGSQDDTSDDEEEYIENSVDYTDEDTDEEGGVSDLHIKTDQLRNNKYELNIPTDLISELTEDEYTTEEEN